MRIQDRKSHYIPNLMHDLIGKNHYDEAFKKIKDDKKFFEYVKDSLFVGDVQKMNPETLGKIMSSFEDDDVKASKVDLFTNITFGGNECEKLLRELVAVCLAYLIRDYIKAGHESSERIFGEAFKDFFKK